MIVGGIAAAVSLFLIVFLVMPKMSSVKEHQKQLDQAEQDGQQLAAQVAALLQAKHDAASVQRQVHALDQQIPTTAALSRLITQMKRAADLAAVDFVQISPGTPVSGTTGFSTIPTQINATGSYSTVTEFLYRLESMPRAVKVTNITLGPGPDGAPQLSLQLTANVFTTDISAGPGSQPGPTAGIPDATATTGAGA
jgi:Tfp pilus assembly protein PilO